MSSYSKAESRSVREKANRAERRRRQTRARLVAAARSVMARKGVEATTINEITEEADVGFGTFYNHFESKEAIVDEVIDGIIDLFLKRLDELTEGTRDAAEVMAIIVHNFMRLVDIDPELVAFVNLIEPVRPDLGDEIGRQLRPHLERGIASGRFEVPDLKAARVIIGGTIYLAMQERLRDRLAAENDRAIVELVLRMLGLPAAEAREVARRRLPSLADSATSTR